MKRIAVELVPRSEEGLREELKMLKEARLKVDRINIPDLLRCELRSWEGAAIAQEYYPALPHIRAMDVDLSQPLAMGPYIREHEIREVLVIEGDPPQDMTHTVYPTVTTDVIRKIREELPGVRVWAGIDQYRGSMQQELYNIRRKLQAGAVGFFTQPFFDMRFLEMYADMLDGLTVCWGVSPITSEKTQSYWERKNHVIFPKSFSPTLEWSIDFARKVLGFAQRNGDRIYFMPIKSNIEKYLSGILK